jgi:hypothetical protein
MTEGFPVLEKTSHNVGRGATTVTRCNRWLSGVHRRKIFEFGRATLLTMDGFIFILPSTICALFQVFISGGSGWIRKYFQALGLSNRFLAVCALKNVTGW